MNIYNKEILELEKEFIMKIINELKIIMNFIIKKNSKAYYEIQKTIFHCDLKIAGEDGKRIDVRKNDLLDMRVKFAKNLNDLGIEATATRKYSGKSKELEREK